jgi:hypothetical protein
LSQRRQDHPSLRRARRPLRVAQLGHGRIEQGIRARAAEVAKHLRERLTLDQLHGVEVAAVGLADGVDRDDVGVVQLGGGLRLALEPLDRLLREPEPGRQDLEGDPAIQRQLAGLVDDAHPASADLAQQIEIAEPAQGGGYGRGIRFARKGVAVLGRRLAVRRGIVIRHTALPGLADLLTLLCSS